MTTYFLSGLGADKRIFSRLALPETLKVKHLKWIPNLKDESLGNYARRISGQIDVSESFQLVGVSFGGIVATELAKFLKPEQVVIISSVATRRQLPAYFGVMAYWLRSPFFSKSALKTANPLSYWLFGAASGQTRLFFREVLEQSDGNFLKWAVVRIADWDNIIRAENLYHIHGTHDKIFPIELVKPDYVVKNGEHLMVYDKHREISDVLTERLTTL